MKAEPTNWIMLRMTKSMTKASVRLKKPAGLVVGACEEKSFDLSAPEDVDAIFAYPPSEILLGIVSGCDGLRLPNMDFILFSRDASTAELWSRNTSIALPAMLVPPS